MHFKRRLVAGACATLCTACSGECNRTRSAPDVGSEPVVVDAALAAPSEAPIVAPIAALSVKPTRPIRFNTSLLGQHFFAELDLEGKVHHGVKLLSITIDGDDQPTFTPPFDLSVNGTLLEGKVANTRYRHYDFHESVWKVKQGESVKDLTLLVKPIGAPQLIFPGALTEEEIEALETAGKNNLKTMKGDRNFSSNTMDGGAVYTFVYQDTRHEGDDISICTTPKNESVAVDVHSLDMRYETDAVLYEDISVYDPYRSAPLPASVKREPRVCHSRKLPLDGPSSPVMPTLPPERDMPVLPSVREELTNVRFEADTFSSVGDIKHRPNTLYIGCLAGGVGKAGTWGFWPDETLSGPKPRGSLDFLENFEAAVRMVRADYCGDGKSYTDVGTQIVVDYQWPVLVATDKWSRPSAPSDPLEALWTPQGAACVETPRERAPKCKFKMPRCTVCATPDDYKFSSHIVKPDD